MQTAKININGAEIEIEPATDAQIALLIDSDRRRLLEKYGGVTEEFRAEAAVWVLLLETMKRSMALNAVMEGFDKLRRSDD